MRPLLSKVISRTLCYLVIPLAIVILCSCGGGSSSGNPGPPPTPDFSVKAAPTSVQVAPGSSQNLTISITILGGFTGQVNITVSGLPPGVTASPSSFTLSTGSPQQVALAAQSSALGATVSLTIQAVSGALRHSVQIPLSVQTATSSMHAPMRSRYLRTDSFYGFLQDAPPHFTVYDQPLRRFFVSNPYLNRIDVFDAAQEFQIGSVTVPFAWGIDTSPDGTKLYAGTLIGDVFEVDAVALQVTQRYPAASIGPNGFSASEALVLADGRLALLGPMTGLFVDGEQEFSIWDPISNALDLEYPTVCGVYNIGPFVLSGDRTRVLLGSIDSDGTVCSYDPSTQQGASGSVGGFLNLIEATPDGKRFFVIGVNTTGVSGGAITTFDAVSAQKLQQLETTTSFYGAAVSQDSRMLYVVDYLGLIEAYDTGNLSLKGWVPNFSVGDFQSAIVPGVVDETGLIVGPIGHGVAFVDAGLFQAGALPPAVAIGVTLPVTGPLGGGTQVQNGTSTGVQNQVPGLSQAYLGNSALGGAKEVVLGQNQDPTIVGTTPVSSVGGAADFTAVFQNNCIGIAPESFSYGPTIIELTSNASTAEGGSSGTLVGYGLGQTTSDVQVTVGGQAAPVVALYTGPPIEPYPFPIQGLVFTVPPGTPGGSVDVTVTNVNGSATVSGAFHYAAATNFYPLTATLQQGIYDPSRNLYYFTDRAKIQVFSPSNGQWLSPFTLPNVSGKTQLLAISLSPDGSKLAVSDYGAQAIYVLDPSAPNSAKEYFVPQTGSDYGITPCGLAMLNSGVVYYASNDLAGTGAYDFHKLDTVTGTTTDIPDAGGDGSPADEFIRAISSPDGSRVYSEIGEAHFWVDTSTDQVTFRHLNYYGESTSDMALSADGTTLVVNGFLTDPFMDASSLVVYTDRETFFPTAVLGQKLSRDGALLFQPLTDGIDVIDTQSGRLLFRVQVPVQLSDTYDALVVDGKDNTLVAITTGGIAFIDLTALPLPQATRGKPEHAGRTVGTGGIRAQPRKGVGTLKAPHLHSRRDEQRTWQAQPRQK